MSTHTTAFAGSCGISCVRLSQFDVFDMAPSQRMHAARHSPRLPQGMAAVAKSGQAMRKELRNYFALMIHHGQIGLTTGGFK